MTPESFSSRLDRLAVRRLFGAVRGNARVIVVTEGISNITFQWYGTYLPLYMLALGVTEIQIGWLASVFLLTQFISTLIGGYVADRFGRKRVLVIGDIICWGVPLLLYAVALNPWYLLIGRLINGFIYIVVPGFDCLFVEDVPEKDRPSVFGMLQFVMAAGALLAPVSGYLVAQMGMVTAGRVIMFATMLMAIGIALVRQHTLRETSMGEQRITATQQHNLLAPLLEYRQALAAIIATRQVWYFLLIRVLAAFSTVVWHTYAMIYLTAERGGRLPESMVAVLPTVAALVTIGAVVLSVERFGARHILSNLVIGQGLWLAGALVFVLAPPGLLWFAILWTLITALSAVLFQPASLAYWANIVEDRQRAMIFSAATAVTILATLPAGPLAGWLYTLAPRAPFLITFGLQSVVLLMILALSSREQAAPIEVG